MQKFNKLDTKKSFSSFSWGKAWRYFDRDILVDEFVWSQQLRIKNFWKTFWCFKLFPGWPEYRKNCPMFWKVANKKTVAKPKLPKYPNQISTQKSKYVQRTAFETLKYLQQTKFWSSLFSQECKKSANKKVAQKCQHVLGYFFIKKNHSEIQKVAQYMKSHPVWSTWGQCYKTFFSVVYTFLQWARVFVPDKIFQHRLANTLA
jgi:hypothetical protein